jgi:DNA-binding winged helix-turn-helix (wHTH) protein/TolB-like protein/Tfp pilus assembly protein PilF
MRPLSSPFRWHFSGKLVAATTDHHKYMSALGNPVYRFGSFELEPAERRLSEAGRAVSLTPKVFDTLVLLVERAGHVVSKDELMKLLWPRGYVDESNLTKHIWLIRRALGDGEHDSRFIETVPKLGYRFIGQVTSGAEVAPRTPHSDPGQTTAAPAPAASLAGSADAATASRAAAPGPGSLPRRAWLLAAALVTALFAITLGWRLISRHAASPLAGHRGRAVAFVGFANLSHNSKDAWLAPALTEMLGAELNIADDLQVVPDELVRDASTDLAPPAAGGYSPQTLASLRERLDVDYVVSGSYLVAGSSDNAPLRVDIALQDARNGSLLASVSNQSGVSGLMALVTQTGATLRGKLGASSPSAATLSLVANEHPPSVDVARRIGFALDALSNYDAARARDELLEAVAEAPGYAPAYTYLAQAWSALGYHDKALAAAEQAARNAATLPAEQRLQAEAIVESARSEWGKAASAWQALAKLKPANLEYRLQWIDAQIGAGTAGQAQGTLSALRRLPNAAGDPRVELAAARIAGSLDDAKGNAEHAANALLQAQQHDAPGLVADAQLQLAGARNYLHQSADARTSVTAAIAGYRAIRNPRGEATARRMLARVLDNLGRGQEAREEYQRALALYHSIGDVAGIAGVYRDLCNMLWLAGDRDGAQAAARHSLGLAREIGDLHLQAWTLRALATIASDEAASDEVLNEYREVIALNERSGDRGGHAWSLASYADVERMRGNLDEARAYCARADAEAATLSDPQFAVFSGLTCALVEVDRGNGDAGRTALEEVIRRVGSGGDTTYRDNALLTLAQLDMDDARWSAARERLRAAARGFAVAEVQTGEADALAMLALCAQALGDNAERDQAAERARKLRQSITSRQEVYVVDIALARLAGETRKDGAAAQKLLALAADAEQRHWLGWSLEAKLAAWELLHARATDSTAASALRLETEATARRHGFGRILNILQRRDVSRSAPH